MIINPHIHSLIKTYMNQQVKGSAPEPVVKAGVSTGADKMQFSQEGKVLLSAFQAVKELPDVRSEKVAVLKAAVRTGTYAVSDQAVAEKLLESKVFDKLI